MWWRWSGIIVNTTFGRLIRIIITEKRPVRVKRSPWYLNLSKYFSWHVHQACNEIQQSWHQEPLVTTVCEIIVSGTGYCNSLLYDMSDYNLFFRKYRRVNIATVDKYLIASKTNNIYQWNGVFISRHNTNFWVHQWQDTNRPDYVHNLLSTRKTLENLGLSSQILLSVSRISVLTRGPSIIVYLMTV